MRDKKVKCVTGYSHALGEVGSGPGEEGVGGSVGRVRVMLLALKIR